MERTSIGRSDQLLAGVPAVRAGDFVFVSGHLSPQPGGDSLTFPAEVQTAAVFEDIAATLAEARSSPAKVAKLQTSRRLSRNEPLLDTIGARGGSMHVSMDQLLADARFGLERVAVGELRDEVAAGALLVDIRPLEQRQRDGDLNGALVIDRNVLEWRLAPSSGSRLVDLDQDRRVILVCNEGYSSSLAAATLQELGLARATDLIGGFQALLASGHPTVSGEPPG